MRPLHLVSSMLFFAGIAATGCQSKKVNESQSQAANPAAKVAVAPFITGMRQVTLEGTRAGEGYFSKDGHYLVFQSEREPGNPFYQIYVRDNQTGSVKRVSPGQGKTTCAWIKPDNKKVLFASTHLDPDLKKKVEEEWQERKEPKKRYNWSFDDAYDIFETGINGGPLKNLTHTMGYDAEGSYSPDGQWIAFASNRAGYSKKLTPEEQTLFEKDASVMMDIYIMKSDGTQVKQLTNTLGYDGGPFFSPDGKRLTFRRFAPTGHTAEIFTIGTDGKNEKQITHIGAMSWAPFYHPSGDYLIFASNKEGYANFELFIVDVNGRHDPVRVSDIPGFDGLPVFTPDGENLYWTHSDPGGQGQIYQAKWNDTLARKALGLPASQPTLHKLTADLNRDDAMSWINFLASEHFEGRMSGGITEPEYAEAIANYFKSIGLKPAIGKDFLQRYEFTSGVELGDKNSLKLSIGDQIIEPQLNKDWVPVSYSKTGSFANAPVVFAGYGIVATANSTQPEYNSFGNLEVKGKWVLVFNDLPDDISNERRFHLHLYSRLQHKAMMAREKGAVGLIVVDDSRHPQQDLKLKFEGRMEDSGIAVVKISSDLANKIFASKKATIAQWTEKLAKGEIGTEVFPTTKLQAETSLRLIKSQTTNVVAKLDVGAPLSIALGAHMDHLGHGESGNSLDKEKGRIHFGADDNASGVATVLELAHRLSTLNQQHQIKLKKNLIFALWTGEEIGTLGSGYFVNHLPPKLRIDGYVNFDMVGRLRQELLLQGVASAKEWSGLVEQANVQDPINIKTQNDPYLPTDAMPFYLKGIPAISYFTGSHADYHTHFDTPDKINADGLIQIAHHAEQLVRNISESNSRLTYQKVEGNPKSSGGGRGFRLYLGTIPDYSKEDIIGVAISGLSKDSPADKAGLKPGDIIVELGGMEIRNMNDYVYCLQALKAGEKTKMKVLRAGNKQDLEIIPALRTQQ